MSARQVTCEQSPLVATGIRGLVKVMDGQIYAPHSDGSTFDDPFVKLMLFERRVATWILRIGRCRGFTLLRQRTRVILLLGYLQLDAML
jgi:hypothetical protein